MSIIEHVQQKLREKPIELLNLKSQNVTVNLRNFSIIFGLEILNENIRIGSYHKMISFNDESESCTESIDIYYDSGNSIRFNRLYSKEEYQLENISICWYDSLSFLQKDILHILDFKIITDTIKIYDKQAKIVTKLVLNNTNENSNSNH